MLKLIETLQYTMEDAQMSPQSNENQVNQQQDANDTPVTFTVTIGELNAIFGTINAGSFKAVMQPIIAQLSQQVQAHQLPQQQTQAEVLAMTVHLTVKLGELNSILNIINTSGFAAVMKPTVDRITEQVQFSVNAANAEQQVTSSLPLQMMSPPNTQ